MVLTAFVGAVLASFCLFFVFTSCYPLCTELPNIISKYTLFLFPFLFLYPLSKKTSSYLLSDL